MANFEGMGLYMPKSLQKVYAESVMGGTSNRGPKIFQQSKFIQGTTHPGSEQDNIRTIGDQLYVEPTAILPLMALQKHISRRTPTETVDNSVRNELIYEKGFTPGEAE